MWNEKIYLERLQEAIGLQATGDRLQATGDRLQATDYRQQATGDRLQATEIEHISAMQGTLALTTTDKIVLARAMMRQQQQLLTLAKVWEALEKEGVRPVLLKGLGLARLYPEPYRRVSSDVDLWVGKGQYNTVTRVLERTLEVEWHHENESVNERHYNFNTRQGLVFEIHPQTIPFILPEEKAALEAIEIPAMENAEEFEFEGYRFRMPEAGFNLLFVFMHAWEHFTSSGMSMKQLADLAILLKDPSPSEPEGALLSKGREWLPMYSQTLKDLHLLEPWEVTGYVVVKAFGLSKEQWPGYKDTRRTRRLGERLYKRIMKEGLTRHQTPDTKHKINKWIGKVVTLWSRIRTTMMIAPYSPKYARHFLYCAIYKGIKRLRK